MSKTKRRGGNKKIFNLARLASESNFTLASEDLHSPGDENMKNENHLNVAPLFDLHVDGGNCKEK